MNHFAYDEFFSIFLNIKANQKKAEYYFCIKSQMKHTLILSYYVS